MKYVNRLTDEQIKEIVKIFLPETLIKKIKLDNINNIFNDIFLINVVLKSNQEWCLDLNDYSIEYTNSINNEIRQLNNKPYRKKMLEYFGEQYAIDYLLGE